MSKTNQLHFTKAVLHDLPLPNTGKRSYYYDDKVDGLQIAITHTGTRTFYLYRKVQGKPERIKLGHFPHITPEQARKAAQMELAKITMGRNPQAERRAATVKGVTLADALNTYLTVRKLKPKTAYDYRRAMDVAFPDWLTRPLAQLRKDAISERHQTLGKQRGEAYANLAMRVLRAVINFARHQYENDKGEPLLPENPVARLSQTRTWFRNKRRETVIRSHQIKPWYDAVIALKTDGDSFGSAVSDYLLLLLLTGLRRQEAATLQWANVDLIGRTLTIPDTKNHKDHTLPLSTFLHALLSARQKNQLNDYVFPGSGKQGYLIEPRNSIADVIAASGVSFVLHDLRRTFLTIAESLDIPAYALKGLANHTTSGDVTAGYIQMTPDRLRQPMQLITDTLLYYAGVNKKLPKDLAHLQPLTHDE